MRKRRHRERLVRFIAAVAIGGSALQLGSCDPLVRSTLLTGLEATSNALTDTLISAFFVSLQDDETEDTQQLTTTSF